MNVSRRWLEAFLRRPLDARDVARRLTMLGAPVDAIEPIHQELAPFVVARVLEVKPHPDPKATKVRLTLVDDGSGSPKQVVCGAPNVAAGGVYPFARLGTVMPEGFTIEPRTIRGVTSHGMLCSARELGLGADQSGLLELATDAPPGTPLLDVLEVSDERLVLDVTANRADLLGHKGVARELAASYGVPFRMPEIPGSSPTFDVAPARRSAGPASTGGVSIAIEDAEGCTRFVGAVLRGVKVGPSPAWLSRRLEAVGVRSINNVVDATNYVMLELSRPMHAYDLATLAGPAIVVRTACGGEKAVTLDGVERTLAGGMTVIADAGRVIGIAGIMGGQETEVSDRTTDVFLECANWTPSRIRATRKALGISTEASHRFERGVDPASAIEATIRCIQIIQATGGGTLADAPIDIYPVPEHPPRIFLRPARVARLLGIELPWSEIERCLVAIGATVVAKPDDGRMAVDVPSWRGDLTSEIDLVEEIARIYGYDEIPVALGGFRPGLRRDAPIEVAAQRVRRGLVALGLYEAMTLPMGPADGEASVRILNPLASTDPFLRRQLLPGLLRQVERNWARQVRDVRLFEIGTVFERGAPGELPHEERRVAGVITGAREPAHWTGSGRAADVDLWDLRGLFEAAVGLAFPSASVQVETSAWVARAPDGAVVGRAERLAGDAPPWAAPVFGFEVRLDPSPRSAPRFAGLPSTPSSSRDLALVLAEGTSAAAVAACIRRTAPPFLESVAVLDEYRGGALPAGTRSVTFRLVFRAPDRTLRDAEVDEAVRSVVTALETELGAHLRAS
ncbi:MAG: phenylalanine--tRNA ligase subunit beta [Gemmatimonadota bacterium]